MGLNAIAEVLSSSGSGHALVLVTLVQQAGCTPEDDVTTESGFMRAAHKVGRVRQGGLVSAAPECSSFVFPNSSGHKRTQGNNYVGDESKRYVQTGNLIAMATSLLLAVAFLRGAVPLFENPPRSVIYKYAPVSWLFSNFSFSFHAVVAHCAYDVTTALGQRTKKDFRFSACGQWVEQIQKACSCGDAPHVQLMTTFVQSNTGRAKHVGEVRSTGNKEALKRSGAYPKPLGQAIVMAWRQGPPAGAGVQLVNTPKVAEEAAQEAVASQRPHGKMMMRKRPAASWQDLASESDEAPAVTHNDSTGQRATRHVRRRPAAATWQELESEQGSPAPGDKSPATTGQDVQQWPQDSDDEDPQASGSFWHNGLD